MNLAFWPATHLNDTNVCGWKVPNFMQNYDRFIHLAVGNMWHKLYGTFN